MKVWAEFVFKPGVEGKILTRTPWSSFQKKPGKEATAVEVRELSEMALLMTVNEPAVAL